MSRHRNVRNLVEDDYYDDDDDYYEDDYGEYDNNTYSLPPKAAVASNPAKKSVAAVGTTAGKANKNNNTSKASKGTVAGAGSSKAPILAKAVATTSAATTSAATTSAATTSAGVSQPPPGWGKPSTSTGAALPQKQQASASTLPVPGTATAARPTTRSKSPKRGGSGGAERQATHVASVPYTPKPIPDFIRNSKSQLSMVILGHVDAGKSTLVGQILVLTGQVTKREAAKQGNLSWLLDENESERSRGVTMEMGTKTLRVPRHDIVIGDSPGHRDFIPVMITGAANADVAVLVVAGTTGEFEAGFSLGGQTKEHILLARGLGVTQIIVAINKLDVEGWKEDRYNQIEVQVKDYLLKQEFKPKRTQFVPISGLTGENVKVRQDAALSKWYKGPTLLEAIDNFLPVNRQMEKPLRFIVTDVYEQGKLVACRGRVVQGFVEVGDRLVVLPVGDIVTVTRVEHLQPPSDDIADPKRLAVAIAGDIVELSINDIDSMRISVGNILSFPNARPLLAKRALAKILVMEKLSVPIIRGAQVSFHIHNLDIPAIVTKLVAILKRDGSVKKERPRALTSGVSAVVELTLSDRIVVESFAECRALGRFALRRSGDTIAIGVIDETF